ncbi:MAG: hypothetical protein ACOC8B_08745 [Gemmatimonadota bacterium]
MPFRPSRERRGPDPHLDVKIIVFVVGAALAVVGIAMEIEWLVTVAIAVLAAGVLLRFLRPRPD